MGVLTWEVGYTSGTTGRGEHDVHKGHVEALAKKILCGPTLDSGAMRAFSRKRELKTCWHLHLSQLCGIQFKFLQYFYFLLLAYKIFLLFLSFPILIFSPQLPPAWYHGPTLDPVLLFNLPLQFYRCSLAVNSSHYSPTMDLVWTHFFQLLFNIHKQNCAITSFFIYERPWWDHTRQC
jgi:hypothetical protein